MSSPSESVEMPFTKGESEWAVLDRVVSLAPFLKAKEVTLELSEFTEPCGYTMEISNKLFYRADIWKRRSCENHGVTSVNAEKE